MDYFAAFGERPRPWLDPAALQQKFLALSSELHPDKFLEPAAKADAEKRFALLNQSYLLLRQPRSRLLHFLELTGVAADPRQVQSVPETVAGFFQPIAEQTRKADDLLKEKSTISSPMLKARFFEKALDATASLQEWQARLTQEIKNIEAELRELDGAWLKHGDRSTFPRLRAAAAALGFLERWRQQLEQRLAALAF